MKPPIYSGVSYLHVITEVQSLAARELPRQGLGIPLSKVGFPIRKSTDQSFFAAPRGLSQRSTSFIASQRQGIHQMPLRHLIALIINAHPARQRNSDRASLRDNSTGRTLIRKTSLLLETDPMACGQACQRGMRTAAAGLTPASNARIDLLFTMSDNTTPRRSCDRHGVERCSMRTSARRPDSKSRLVEPDGIEPTTSCLQSRRSPN